MPVHVIPHFMIGNAPARLQFVHGSDERQYSVPPIVSIDRSWPVLRVYLPRPRKRDGVATLRRIDRAYVIDGNDKRYAARHDILKQAAQHICIKLGWTFFPLARQNLDLSKIPGLYRALYELEEIAGRG